MRGSTLRRVMVLGGRIGRDLMETAMNNRFWLQVGIRLGLASVLVALAVPAAAHPKLVSADPAVGTAAASPKKISVHLSEKLEPKFSGVELKRADGSDVPVVAKVGGKDGKTIEAKVKGKLAAGGYKVMWHAVAADGHRVKGDYIFTVR